MSTLEEVWYLLVGANGKPYKNAKAALALLPPSCFTARFQNEVKKDNPNKLASVDCDDLRVYANMAALTGKKPLSEDAIINGLGHSKADPVLVLVPGG
jgi:hypothetical protein